MSQIKILTATIILALSASMCFAQKTHKISPTQAGKIALAKYHGKLAKKPVLEHEDGKWQYEVIVMVGKTMKEVNVGADSGKIESVENTSPSEEKKEAKKEGKKKGD